MERMEEKELRRRRRIEKFRMRRYARAVQRLWFSWTATKPNVGGEDSWAIKNADHLKNCSCEMCINPRRSGWTKRVDKLTMQEKKFEEMRKIQYGHL